MVYECQGQKQGWAESFKQQLLSIFSNFTIAFSQGF